MTQAPSFSPLSLIAIRVPPIQFTLKAGQPLKLVNTDLMSGCGIVALPKSITDILKLLQNGLGLTINAAMTAINSAIAGITGTLSTFISQAAGGLLGDLQALQGALTTGILLDLNQAIGSVGSSIINTAAVITNISQLAMSLSLPALPSPSAIFAGIVGGSLNAAISGAGLDVAMGNIVSTLNAAIGNVSSLTGLVAPLTSAFSSAVTAALSTVNAAIAGITSAIDQALSNLMGAIASASAIIGGMLCAELSEFKDFVNSIATPALKAVLPQ